MTAGEVRALIVSQVGDAMDKTNLHGLTVRESLLDPVRTKVVYPSPGGNASTGEEVLVWLVLEERQDSSGYKIVYDDGIESFGLATPGKDGHPATVVSSSKSFLFLFEGM